MHGSGTDRRPHPTRPGELPRPGDVYRTVLRAPWRLHYVLVRLDSPHLNGATADCAEAESGARGFSLGYIHFVGFPAVPLQTAGSYPPIHQSIKLPIYLCICSILLFVC